MFLHAVSNRDIFFQLTGWGKHNFVCSLSSNNLAKLLPHYSYIDESPYILWTLIPPIVALENNMVVRIMRTAHRSVQWKYADKWIAMQYLPLVLFVGIWNLSLKSKCIKRPSENARMHLSKSGPIYSRWVLTSNLRRFYSYFRPGMIECSDWLIESARVQRWLQCYQLHTQPRPKY